MSHGEISVRLRSIYLFCKRNLVEAGATGDVEMMETVSRLLAGLHEAFAEVADRALVASR